MGLRTRRDPAITAHQAHWAARAATIDPEAMLWKFPSSADGLLTALSPATVSCGTAPRGVTVSPDGLSVYVANSTASSVSQYSRDTSTGALTALSPATVACGAGPIGVAVSPDGTSAYVTNATDNTLSLFTRDPVTGKLTAKASPTIAVGTAPRRVIVSPDGLSVYVSNFTDNTISQFARAGNGTLTALSPATISTGTGPIGLAIGPLGLTVYVANFTTSTIGMYSRDSSTGLLTALSTPTIACSSGPFDVAVSPDGYNAYAVTFTNNLVFTFNRRTSDGLLTNVYGSQATSPSGGSPKWLAISPDGHTVYVPNSGAGMNSVGMWTRNADGPLIPQVPPNAAAGTGSEGVAVSPDGLSVYVTNPSAASVSQLSRNTDGIIDFTPGHTVYPIAGYDTVVGKVGGAYPNTRFEIRRAGGLLEQPFPHTPDLRVISRQVQSSYLAVDPTLVSVADPYSRFHERLDKLVGSTLTRQVRSIALVRGTANGSYATRIDGTRRHFDSGVRSSSTGLAISDTQQAAQQFDFPISAPVNTVLPVSVNLANGAGYSGNITLDIVTETTGLPGTTVIGTATIARADLAAVGAAVDSCWITKNVTLTAAISPLNRVWVRLKGTGAGATAANWRAARGNNANTSIVTQGSETQYYRAAVSTDSGTTFTTAAVPVQQGLYSLRIIPADLPNFMIAHVTQFQSFFTVLVDGITRAALNIWDESIDSGGGSVQLRYNHEPWLPWKLTYGMHLGGYKIAPEVASSNPESVVTAIVVELPTDGSW